MSPEKRVAPVGEAILAWRTRSLALRKPGRDAGTVTQADAVRANAEFLDVKIKLFAPNATGRYLTPLRSGHETPCRVPKVRLAGIRRAMLADFTNQSIGVAEISCAGGQPSRTFADVLAIRRAR